MYRDILTNKWFLAGFGFLVIYACACYLFYQHTTAPYRQQAAELDEIIRKYEKQRTAETANPKGQAADAPVQSNTSTAEKLKTKTHGAKIDTSTDETTDPDSAATQVTDNTEEVRMSPHGFGTYPEIPNGAPIAAFHESHSIEMELILRVAVKAWNAGERFRGASGDSITGKVYLHYPNTLYVWYTTVDNGDGTFTRRISRGKSGDDVNLSQEQIRTGNIPPGIRIIEMDKAGIEPYSYLGLH